jgi:hypothetical protein
MIKSASRSPLQSDQQTHLTEQSREANLRRLIAQCQELVSDYQTTSVVAQERSWWQALYRAGVCLRDALEEHRDHWHTLRLTTREIEQAYVTLLRVAYFFEPGGVAEAVFQKQGWVWSDNE